MRLDFQQFAFANLLANPKRLPDGIGVDARNIELRHGDFRGIQAADVKHTLTGISVQQISAHRMGKDVVSDTQYWLTSSSDTDWVPSMKAIDPTEDTYYTSTAHAPRFTNNTFLGSPPYPNGFFALGVPAPSGAMLLAVLVAGTGPNEDRVYTDTFVRGNGDESAPNAATATITVPGGSTVSITNLASVPSGQHGIATRKIYVYNGVGEFQQCVSQSAAIATATDSLARGAVLTTGGSVLRPAWLEPPTALVGLTGLWNGMMGGHIGKSYRVCVPYKPHAWPLEYEKIITDTIIGSATWGRNWLLLTSGYPRLVVGTTPMNMNDEPVYFAQACRSKRSIRSVGHGVCWASNDGICYVGEAGPARVITEPFLSEAAFQALNPASMIGGFYKGWYICFYGTTTRRAFMIDPANPQGIIWLDQGAYGVSQDPISGALFTLDTSFAIRKWRTGLSLVATHKSGIRRAAEEFAVGAIRVQATTYPVTLTVWAFCRIAPGNINTRAWVQIFSGDILGEEPRRIQSGYTAQEFQIQITGQGPVESVQLAGDLQEIV